MPDPVPSRLVIKRPSRLWKWFRAAEFAVQLALAVGFVVYGIHHYRAATGLRAAQAELDRTDPGWRLQDIEAARAVVPEEENSALRVMEAARLLPEPSAKWFDADFDTQLQQVPPQRRLTADQFARLRRCLDAQYAPLAVARTLRDMPRGRYPIVYARNPLGTLLKGEQQSRHVCKLLQLDAWARAEAGDGRGAVASCRAGVNCGRAIGDEPLAISQLVRIAEVIIACQTLGRVLAQTEPPPDDLKDLQHLLTDEDAFPYWWVTWRGERAFGNAVLEALESGEVTRGEFGDGPPDWQDRYFPYYFQDNVRTSHVQYLRNLSEMREAGELPAPLRNTALQQARAEAEQAGLSMSTVLIPALWKMDTAFKRSHALLRCYAAALAAERYRRAHGDWPRSLNQMVPEFLAAVPEDPFTGDDLICRRLPDGVVIYSAGTDGKDDGGDVEAANPALPGTDLGVRLWDPAKRRQPPEPPAAPQNRP